MPRSPQRIAEYAEAATRWEEAQLEAKRLQQLLAAARRTGGDPLTVARIAQEVYAAQAHAANLLTEATKCLRETRPEAH